MSLLKWEELAKRKTELGNKINFVHDTIFKNTLGEKTSQESFQKVFKPIITKLDDVTMTNLNIPRLTKRHMKKEVDALDYGIDIENEVPDYDLDNLFERELEKQIVRKPPSYKESLGDILEGKKEIYVDLHYLPEEPMDLPPEYDEDEDIDYALDDEDQSNYILDDIDVPNYVDKILKKPKMTPQITEAYLKKILKESKFRRNQLKGVEAY